MFDGRVGGEANASAVLTIAPGADLRFEGSRALRIGSEGRVGGLIAVGTPEAPILLTGSGNPDPGHWEGVLFGGDTLDEQAIIEQASIEHARDGVAIVDASPALDHVSLHDNLSCGVETDGDAAPTLGAGMRCASNGEDVCE